MSTRYYTLPVDQTKWEVPSGSTTIFNWEYDETRDRLLNLYEKGKERQWNSNTRLDWSTEVDPGSADNYPEFYVPIYGSDIWERMNERERWDVRHHTAAWTNSQMAYPINPHLKALLNDVIRDERWDMTYLGMQVLIEGLALAAFSMIRDYSDEPLAKAINTYVMQDEARHVAFGRLALRDYYPQLTDAERAEREEFIVYACYLMRNRFLAEEVWENLGLDVAECLRYVESSEMLRAFRKMLFSRIVPTVKDLGLFGPKVRTAFEDMGVIEFQDVNPDDLSAADEALAEDLDQRRGLLSAEEAATASLAGIDRARAEEVKATIQAAQEH